MLASGMAHAETRTLKLYFIHTRERAEITFKRDGKFIPSGLAQINKFLRDWRKNESTKMDPRVIDLLWEVYQASGSRDYIHIICGYRSPGTNAMLRSRSSGVAEKSQHMLGKAIDFYIPDVKLSKLRQTAMRFQYGGVGYYPTSGSPFVHIDVGNARYWPRMSRGDLMAMFPDGKSVYVPSDGKPLAGYTQALASYKARRSGGADIQLASAAGGKPHRGFLANLFGGGADEDEDSADVQVASAAPARSPATIAASGKAAVAAAATEPASPAAIIAALPAKSIPLPGVAPRPDVDVGVAAAPAPAVEEPASPYPQLALLKVPLPTPRPDYTPPSAAPLPVEPPVQVASAEAAPSAAELRGVQEATANAAAGLQQATAPATLAAYVPLPTSRPATEADVTMAALSKPHTTLGKAQSSEAAFARAEAKEMIDQKLARLASAPSASPRLALIAREAGTDASSVLSTGPRTTDKGARPTMADERPDPRSIAIPVPRQVARWALSNEPVTLDTRGTTAPSFAHAFVRSAPQMVYTAGFQTASAQPDPNRFTGHAVVFLSVARFQN
jgi:uncharacterized protein YcbK (DUF882 family)